MISEDFEPELKDLLKKVDSDLHNHLLKFDIEQGSPVWAERFLKGIPPICGPGLTQLINFLPPTKRKDLVKSFAAGLSEKFGENFDRSDIKEAIDKVFNDLIAERKAIMFGMQSQFLNYLLRLTHLAFEIIKEEWRPTKPEGYRETPEWSEKLGKWLPPTVVRLDEEDSLIEQIDEKRFRDSLESVEVEIWEDYKAGHGVRYSEGKLKVPKSTVAEIRLKLEAKWKELEGN